MRFLLKVGFDTATANKLIKDGTLNRRLQAIMAELKP